MISNDENGTQVERTETLEEVKRTESQSSIQEQMTESQKRMMERSTLYLHGLFIYDVSQGWPMARLEDISMTTSLVFNPHANVPYKGSMLGEPNFIKVCNPVVKEEAISKYIVYTVKGSDTKGDFEIFRRYSQFHALRTVLLERWPGLYIPPLPEKKLIGNLSPDFIEDRRRYLEIFLNTATKIPYLYYSEEMQFFLRSQVSDVKAGLFALPKPSYEAIITRYTTAFSDLSGKELSNQVLGKIENFGMFLRTIKASFEAYKNVAKGLVAAKRDYYDRLVSFHKNVLLDYERNCISEYSPENPPYVFNADSNGYLNIQIGQIREASLKASFDAFLGLLKHEDKEIDAFLEALESRRKCMLTKSKIQSKVQSDTQEMMKISSGKSTIKTVFSSKPKEHHVSEYETIIAMNNKNIENLSLLYDMITLILAYVEIDKFKANKIETYIKITKQMALFEHQANLEVSNFWGNVLKTDVLRAAEQKAEDLQQQQEKMNGPSGVKFTS